MFGNLVFVFLMIIGLSLCLSVIRVQLSRCSGLNIMNVAWYCTRKLNHGFEMSVPSLKTSLICGPGLNPHSLVCLGSLLQLFVPTVCVVIDGFAGCAEYVL